MRVAARFLPATLCVSFASHAVGATYDNLFVFGDSTVDSGWWAGSLATPPRTSRPLHGYPRNSRSADVMAVSN